MSVILLAERSLRRAPALPIYLGYILLKVYYFTLGQGGDPLVGGAWRAPPEKCSAPRGSMGGRWVPEGSVLPRVPQPPLPHACPDPRLTRTPPDQNPDQTAGRNGKGGERGGHGVWAHLIP